MSRSWRGPCWVLHLGLTIQYLTGLTEDARLLRLIRASFVASHGIYGAPRILQDLRERGETCSKHRVARLMRENGLRRYMAIALDTFQWPSLPR